MYQVYINGRLNAAVRRSQSIQRSRFLFPARHEVRLQESRSDFDFLDQ